MSKEQILKQDEIGTARSSLGDSVRNAGHRLDSLGEKVGTATDELIKKTSQVASDLKKNAGQYTDDVAGFISDNPVKSTLIAGGVGLLLGLILKK